MSDIPPKKKIAIAFVMEGIICVTDEFAIQRVLKVLKESFPATKIENIRLVRLDEIIYEENNED